MVDGEALPLPSQAPAMLGGQGSAWLPPMRTWEVKGKEEPETG